MAAGTIRGPDRYRWADFEFKAMPRWAGLGLLPGAAESPGPDSEAQSARH